MNKDKQSGLAGGREAALLRAAKVRNAGGRVMEGDREAQSRCYAYT